MIKLLFLLVQAIAILTMYQNMRAKELALKEDVEGFKKRNHSVAVLQFIISVTCLVCYMTVWALEK